MNEDAIGNPSPGAFDLDANLLRSNLPLTFHGGNLKSPMKVEKRRLGWLEDE